MMNKSLWLVLIFASEALLSTPAMAVNCWRESVPGLPWAASNEGIVLTVVSVDGKEYIRSSFGRLPGGELRPNCIEDKEIHLPVEAWRREWSESQTLISFESENPLLLAIASLESAASVTAIDDLVISRGPMAGTWKYRSCKFIGNTGLMIKWVREDNVSVQTVLPWAAIFNGAFNGDVVSRSRFDAPFCRE